MKLVVNLSFARTYSNWLYRIIGLRLTVVALLIFLFFILYVLPMMAGRLTEYTGVAVSPDTSFFYSPAELYQMAEAYGDAGRAFYVRQRYTFDLVWPFAYYFFFTSLITYLLARCKPGSFIRYANLLPLFAFLFDLLENISVSLVMARYPQSTAPAAALAPFFTAFKWMAIVLTIIALLIGLYYKLSNSFREIKRNQPSP